jgi:hypothetical protein
MDCLRKKTDRILSPSLLLLALLGLSVFFPLPPASAEPKIQRAFRITTQEMVNGKSRVASAILLVRTEDGLVTVHYCKSAAACAAPADAWGFYGKYRTEDLMGAARSLEKSAAGQAVVRTAVGVAKGEALSHVLSSLLGSTGGAAAAELALTGGFEAMAAAGALGEPVTLCFTAYGAAKEFAHHLSCTKKMAEAFQRIEKNTGNKEFVVPLTKVSPAVMRKHLASVLEELRGKSVIPLGIAGETCPTRFGELARQSSR